MTVLGIVLLVFFVIVAVLLILLVLAQNEEGDSLGGIFAGGGGSAFGSRSGNVLTRATTILGALFLIISFGLALVNRSDSGRGVESAARELAPEAGGTWWQEDAAAGSDAAETTAPALDYSPEAADTPAEVPGGLNE